MFLHSEASLGGATRADRVDNAAVRAVTGFILFLDQVGQQGLVDASLKRDHGPAILSSICAMRLLPARLQDHLVQLEINLRIVGEAGELDVNLAACLRRAFLPPRA